MKLGAIILAGGYSTRFKGPKLELPTAKQHMVLGGESLIEIAIRKYSEFTDDIVVSSDRLLTIPRTCTKKPVCRTDAATEKSYSIELALTTLMTTLDITSVLLVDVVRPFTSKEHIERIIEKLQDSEVVVSGIPAWETVYDRPNNNVIVRDRTNQWFGQTPEGWRVETLQLALARAKRFTDDYSYSFSSVMQGDCRIELIEGTPENFKINFWHDFLLAKLLAETHPDYLWK